MLGVYIIMCMALKIMIIIGKKWGMDMDYIGIILRKKEKVCRMGIILFIISEIMVFLGVFWASFMGILTAEGTINEVYRRITEKQELCLILENRDLTDLKLPIFNTIILVTSGSYSQLGLILIQGGYQKNACKHLKIAIWLGLLFSMVQLYEYNENYMEIRSNLYGSVFYVLTGLHGLHVMIGAILIGISVERVYKYKLSKDMKNTLEVANAYWHFVDIIWIFLIIFIY